MVVVNAEPAGRSLTVITSDNVAGAETAIRKLVELGHRAIGYVQGPPLYTATGARVDGFRHACATAGLDPARTPVVAGDGLYEGGVTAGERLLDGGLRVTAIVCYNDLTAIGVLRALREAGVRVPQDVSVVGCDDIAAASWVSPTLTTLVQAKTEMGRLAVERMVTLLKDPEQTGTRQTVRLPMTLLVRESIGPVPAA